MYISRFYDRSKVGLLLGRYLLIIWVWDLNRSHWWWYLYSLKHGLRTHDGSISNSMRPKSYHNPEYIFIWSRLKASLLKKKYWLMQNHGLGTHNDEIFLLRYHPKAHTIYLAHLRNQPKHELRAPNEGINQRNLKIWANVADKICFSHT